MSAAQKKTSYPLFFTRTQRRAYIFINKIDNKKAYEVILDNPFKQQQKDLLYEGFLTKNKAADLPKGVPFIVSVEPLFMFTKIPGPQLGPVVIASTEWEIDLDSGNGDNRPKLQYRPENVGKWVFFNDTKLGNVSTNSEKLFDELQQLKDKFDAVGEVFWIKNI